MNSLGPKKIQRIMTRPIVKSNINFRIYFSDCSILKHQSKFGFSKRQICVLKEELLVLMNI